MRRSGSVSGAVSLVMIFCVLCLAVFAVLTLATAVREKTLSDLSAESTASYYEADTEATRTVASLLRGESPAAVRFEQSDDGRVASFAVELGEKQKLDVKVLLRTDGSYEILRWATVYAAEWEADHSIDLWDGDF